MKEGRAQITIKGKNTEEKFKHTEVILKRLARRMHEKVVGIFPPSVIFHHVDAPDSSGIILKGILPKGTLTKVCLAVGKYKEQQSVKILCKFEPLKGVGHQYTFETRKPLVVEDINLSIEDTNFFSIGVEPSDAHLIEDIWLTILFQFDRSNSQVRELMLEELLKLESLDEGI